MAKIDTEVAHVTCDSWLGHHFQGQKVNLSDVSNMPEQEPSGE